MRGKNADAGDPPTFSDAEDIVLADNGTPADAETLTTLRRQTRARLGRIARLEQACASTITLLQQLNGACKAYDFAQPFSAYDLFSMHR